MIGQARDIGQWHRFVPVSRQRPPEIEDEVSALGFKLDATAAYLSGAAVNAGSHSHLPFGKKRIIDRGPFPRIQVFPLYLD